MRMRTPSLSAPFCRAHACSLWHAWARHQRTVTMAVLISCSGAAFPMPPAPLRDTAAEHRKARLPTPSYRRSVFATADTAQPARWTSASTASTPTMPCRAMYAPRPWIALSAHAAGPTPAPRARRTARARPRPAPRPPPAPLPAELRAERMHRPPPAPRSAARTGTRGYKAHRRACAPPGCRALRARCGSRCAHPLLTWQ